VSKFITLTRRHVTKPGFYSLFYVLAFIPGLVGCDITPSLCESYFWRWWAFRWCLQVWSISGSSAGFTTDRLTTALTGSFWLYFIFGVHYPKKLQKTCTFMAAHNVGLSEPQIPTVQMLY